MCDLVTVEEFLTLVNSAQAKMMHPHRQHGSIDEAVAGGGVITEYHQHESNDHYSATVRVGSEDVIWTNLTQQHMDTLLEMAPMAKKVGKKAHQSLEELIQSGGKIVSVVDHATNPNKGVYVEAPDGAVRAFNNVSPNVVEKLKVMQSGGAGTTSSGSHTRFIDIMREPGAEITDYHPTARNNTYSIHVRSADGSLHNFSNISEEHMEEYCKGFKKGKAIPVTDQMMEEE